MELIELMASLSYTQIGYEYALNRHVEDSRNTMGQV